MRRPSMAGRALIACCTGGLALAGNASAASFVDEHNDGSLSGWTSQGRAWKESNGVASPACCTSTQGFLIRDAEVASNGTLEVKLVADQWNGQKGGVVIRWSSASTFYFVSLQPGNASSNALRFAKNTTDASKGVVVARNFAVGTSSTLKIVMAGSKFDFYVDGVLRGTVTDASNPTGRIGYGYAADWNDYIDFDRISWTESGSGAPVAPSALGVSPVSSTQLNLSWSDNASNETGYAIERATGGGGYAEIARLAANTKTYSNTGLAANTEYLYRVRAFNASGNSAYSAAVSGRTALADLKQRTKYRALVLVYDPVLGARYGSKKVSEYFVGYRNVDTLCKQYIDLMNKASGGQVQLEVAQKHVLDEFPPDIDPNIEFKRDSAIDQWANRVEIRLGDADYRAIAADPRFRITERVNSGDIDFVWVFGTPNSGFWETSMAGPGADWINGVAHPEIPTTRKFVFFGFGRESHQGVGFMCENTAHMAENIFGRYVSPSWPKRHGVSVWNTFDIAKTTRAQSRTFLNDWDYFILSDAANFDPRRTSYGNAQLGLSHYPPTAIHNYDWAQEHGLWWGMFQPFGGTWTEGGLGVSVASGADSRAFAFDGTRSEDYSDPSAEYPMPVLASDFSCRANVSVSNGNSSSSAGFLLRGANYRNTLANLRGYYVGIDAYANRIFVSKFKDGEKILGERYMPIDPDRTYQLEISMIGDVIRVDTVGGKSPMLEVVDFEYKNGGFGYAAFRTAASFSQPVIKASVLSGADNWYSYPNVAGPVRRITAEMEYEGNLDNFQSNDFFYAWWFEHLPKNPSLVQFRDSVTGELSEKYLGTWWPYIFDINQFDGSPIKRNVVFAAKDAQAPASVVGIKALMRKGFVKISWGRPADNVGVTRYEVYRNGILLKKPGREFYEDRDVVDGANYLYSVVALDGSGNRSAAATVSVTYVVSEIVNGDFESSNLLWGKEAWSATNSVMGYEAGAGVGGSQAIAIQNTAGNDASWVQTIEGLVPRAWYRLSGSIKGQGIVNIEGGTKGASLSLMGTYMATEDLTGTFDWKTVSVVFQAPDDGVATIGCRLGHWSNTVTGKAWFDNVTLTKQ